MLTGKRILVVDDEPGIRDARIAISGGGRVGPDLFLTLAAAFGADLTMTKPLSFAQLVQTAAELLGLRTPA